MPDPFAPLIDIARRGTPFTASDGQAFVRLSAPSFRWLLHPPRPLPRLPRLVPP